MKRIPTIDLNIISEQAFVAYMSSAKSKQHVTYNYSCNKECDAACPALLDDSMSIHTYDCLPTIYDIARIRAVHGLTWACHSNPSKPCIGGIQYLSELGLPYSVHQLSDNY